MARASIDAFNAAIRESEVGNQFYQLYYSQPNVSPECRLMVAVLADAVEVLEQPSRKDPKWCRERREAASWVADRRAEGPFAFNTIWATLFGEESLEHARRVLLEMFDRGCR